MFSPEWLFPRPPTRVPSKELLEDPCGVLLQSTSHRINITMTFQLAIHHASRGEHVVFFCNRMEMYNNPPCVADSMGDVDEVTLKRISFHYPQSFEEVQQALFSYLHATSSDDSNLPILLLFENLDSLQSTAVATQPDVFPAKPRRVRKSKLVDDQLLTISLAYHVVGSLRRLHNKRSYFVVCEKTFAEFHKGHGEAFQKYESPLAYLPCVTHMGIVQHNECFDQHSGENPLSIYGKQALEGMHVPETFPKESLLFLFRRVREAPWLGNSNCSEIRQASTYSIVFWALFGLGARFELLRSATMDK
ncbi:hypothetical protein XU18_0144 [Perkinsela sp. CCAP 1560/4]|nr:hypothetical protein XU18_0144 [Perkinsela sp. CCAP 1560/4]|eukprot:KNH09459.1 hypothetical protein XU18_0144 [Perkinsela sp. CCAP 1560/4]